MFNLKVDLRGLQHFGKLTGGYFITTIINQSIPFLVLPILTSFLLPEAYANIALFSFYLALANALVGIAAPNVVSKHFFNKEKTYVAKIIGNAIYSVALFAVASIILIAVLYPFFATFFELPLYMLILTPLASFAYVVFSLGLGVMRNQYKVLVFSKHQIFNTIVNIGLSLFFIIVLSWGWQGRIWGIIIASFISAILVLIYLNRHGFISFAFDKLIFREVIRVITPLIPNSFQAVIIAQSGMFFIQYFFGKSLLGVYSVGFQISYAIYFLDATLAMSLSPFFYEHLAKGNKSAVVYITRMMYLAIGVLLAAAIVLFLFRHFIVSLMTTEAYAGAADFLPYFIIGFLFLGIGNFIIPILITFEKQRFISTWSLISMVFVVFLNVLLPQYVGPWGIAFAFCVGYFIRALAFMVMAQKLYPMPWIRALKIWK